MRASIICAILLSIFLVLILVGAAIYQAIAPNEKSFLDGLQWAVYLTTTLGVTPTTSPEDQTRGLKWLSIIFACFSATFYLTAIIVGVRAVQITNNIQRP
jgi:hypothetical protein